MPVDFDFRKRAVPPTLDRYVESVWYARGTVPYAREHIAPTGSTVAVFVLGPPIRQTPMGGRALTAARGFLVGPHDRPAVNEPTGETYAVGVVTTPVGCEAVFQRAPGALRGRVVDLEEAWGAAAALRRAVCAERDPDAMLDLVVRRVGEGLRRVSGLARCERAVALLEADPTRPVSDIAHALGVSHGHLDREFSRVVGLSPRVLARLLRMRRLLEAIDVHEAVRWGDLAATLGWYDQAHLIRDFKRHTGVTPSKYLAAQRASFGPGEDAAGFVPV